MRHEVTIDIDKNYSKKLQIGYYNLNILHNLHIILLFIKVPLNTLTRQHIPCYFILSQMHWLRLNDYEGDKIQGDVQGGSNMTGTDLCVNKPHCAAAVRP